MIELNIQCGDEAAYLTDEQMEKLVALVKSFNKPKKIEPQEAIAVERNVRGDIKSDNVWQGYTEPQMHRECRHSISHADLLTLNACLEWICQDKNNTKRVLREAHIAHDFTNLEKNLETMFVIVAKVGSAWVTR